MPVFDQGYQHWEGPLSGHAWRWVTIARHGVLVALQNKLLRFLTLVGLFPAFLLASVLVLWGFLEQNADFVKPMLKVFGFTKEMMDDPGRFRTIAWTLVFHFFFKVQLFASMVLVLVAGPGLISQDLRFNAIPLYFSRPLTRQDYFLGKLGVIGFFLFAVAVVPALLGYALGVLFSFKFDVIRDTWHLVPGCLGYGLVIVLSAGTLMLALSSLSSNSRNVAACWIGIWFITNSVAGVLTSIQGQVMVQERMWEIRAGQADREQVRVEAYLADWRPIISYTGNLDRVGRFLLGVDAAAGRVADEVLPPQTPPAFRVITLYFLSGAQYPAYWSALILLVLFGASLWLLTTRVRTLDRL